MKRVIIGLLSFMIICSTVFASSITEIFNALAIRTSFYTENENNHLKIDSDFLVSGEKNFDKESTL